MTVTRKARSDLLYHYTTAIGFEGIVTDGNLWATDTTFLNDAMELQYGRARAVRALKLRARRYERDGESAKSSYVQGALEYFTDPANESTTENVFVTCFCEDGDLLSQWRGYGGAGGYALGFSKEALEAVAPMDTWLPAANASRKVRKEPAAPASPRLRKVKYGRSGLREITSRAPDLLDPGRAGHLPGAYGFQAAANVLLPTLAEIKHPAFKAEREWRLVVASSNAGTLHVKFRAGGLGLVPYVKVPIDISHALREVVVGPGSNTHVRVVAAGMLLTQFHIACRVNISKAPFRG